MRFQRIGEGDEIPADWGGRWDSSGLGREIGFQRIGEGFQRIGEGDGIPADWGGRGDPSGLGIPADLGGRWEIPPDWGGREIFKRIGEGIGIPTGLGGSSENPEDLGREMGLQRVGEGGGIRRIGGFIGQSRVTQL